MIILTPNRRLTAFSLQQYNAEQAANGLKCWVTPEIFPIERWLVNLWEQALDRNLSFYKPLLEAKQQQLLFEQIIQNQSSGLELLRISATAQNAIQAWNFLSQWQIDWAKISAYAVYSPDTAAFHGWIEAYQIWLKENEFVDFNALVKSLLNNITLIIDLIPKQICLRGFNELTPLYAALFKALQEQGVIITRDNLTTTANSVARVAVQYIDEELVAAANWILENMTDSAQTFGVVVPDLESRRDRVYNYFTAIFPKQIFNISAPKPLAHYDLINTGLLILRLSDNVINYEDFSILLRSPFIANYTDKSNVRAILDRNLRENVEARFTIDHLLYILPETCELKVYLNKFKLAINEISGKHSTDYWVVRIQELLQCWGWPGEKLMNNMEGILTELSKDEADLFSCWQNLLEDYNRLHNILPKHSFSEAILYMRRFANETPFAPSETGLTQIHVLGLLEADGLIFDNLWVCGMSRDQWPPAANPNPFIPLEIQREFDLPHSSAQRELIMAKKYTHNLQMGAREQVIFSYPTIIDDNPVAPSNLIIDFLQKQITTTTEKFEPKTHALEQILDLEASPFTAGYISGGTRVLQLQAQCPFKACAEIRMRAKPLQEPRSVLGPDKRGTIVHEVLENFWRTCTSHAQLVNYPREELDNVISKVIEQILQYWQSHLPQTLSSSYMVLEGRRLYNLISRWLEYEKLRPPFVVYELEQKRLLNIGALQVNIMIDRVDLVEDGYVVIDYKTSDTQARFWSKDSIHEPQLQIYATSILQNLSAVAFALLVPGELRFKGLGAAFDILPNVYVDDEWESIRAQWLEQLNGLAADFCAGVAPVAPFDKKICKTCQLQGVCRIYEQ